MNPDRILNACWWLIGISILSALAWGHLHPRLHTSLPNLDEQKPSLEIVMR